MHELRLQERDSCDEGEVTNRFMRSLKYTNVGQKKFITLNS